MGSRGRDWFFRFADATTNTHKGAMAIQARNHAPTGAVVSPIKMPLKREARGEEEDTVTR
jgi:hypothetical protein